MDELKQYPDVLSAAAAWAERQETLTERCIEIQQIPAPTGSEQARAARIQALFESWKLTDVTQDELFNVYGRIPGVKSDPAVLVSAHTDTVFGLETDLSIRVDAATQRIYGPGIGDNSAGVAALLSLADALTHLPPPPVDIWLVANSGEEGIGDLKGMRAAMDRLEGKIGACVVIEGMGLGRIVHRALGSRRFRIRVEAPGGHSWSDFGSPSAIHMLVQLCNDVSRLVTPSAPRTTFNLGRIEGGTSINTIAQHALVELDMRSEDPVALGTLVSQVEEIIGRYRTARWQRQGVMVHVEIIGDRPPGEIDAGHPLVRAAVRTLQAVSHVQAPDLRISSTDANIPLSRGIPAVCIGVTEGGNAHRLQEWIQVEPLVQGIQHLLLLTWWAADWLGKEVKTSSGGQRVDSPV